jgi:hypothetical protein
MGTTTLGNWASSTGTWITMRGLKCPASVCDLINPPRLNGTMGIANAQRSLNYMRILTEFISQPQYKDVIPMFGIVNEAVVDTIGMDVIGSL